MRMQNPLSRIYLAAVAATAAAMVATLSPVAAAGAPQLACYVATDGISGVMAIYGHGADTVWCADNRVGPNQHVHAEQLPDGLALVCTTDGGQAAVYDDAYFPDGSGMQMCYSAMSMGAAVIWNK
jgi:hypothetical protein